MCHNFVSITDTLLLSYLHVESLLMPCIWLLPSICFIPCLAILKAYCNNFLCHPTHMYGSQVVHFSYTPDFSHLCTCLYAYLPNVNWYLPLWFCSLPNTSNNITRSFYWCLDHQVSHNTTMAEPVMPLQSLWSSLACHLKYHFSFKFY